MPTEPDPTVAAQALTKFLTEPRGTYDRTSPIEARVKAEITRLADTLAAEVISSNTELANVVRERIQAVIRAALRDDAYLRSVVVEAVAKGLGRLVEEAKATDMYEDS